MAIKGVATPVIDANEKFFIAEREEVQATCCMGKPKCVEGDGVVIGLDG